MGVFVFSGNMNDSGRNYTTTGDFEGDPSIWQNYREPNYTTTGSFRTCMLIFFRNINHHYKLFKNMQVEW